MTRKQRRERRQADKIARSFEKTLLLGTFKRNLEDLRFEDIRFHGSTTKLLMDLADKECLGYVIGASLGLPDAEITQMMQDHEERLSYNPTIPWPMASGKLAQLLRGPKQ